MSYKELLMKLKQLNAEQLSQTVTVFDHTLQEFIPVDGSDFSADFADVLDFNHFLPTGNDMNEYHFYRNTKFRCHSEQEADLMDSCEEGRESIEFEQFIPNIAPEDWNEVTENLGYDDELKPENDWSVAYFKSEYGGLPCFIFSTTECDFIFLKREDAKMLLERFATSDKPEWGRDTRFGKGGTDRQHGYFED